MSKAEHIAKRLIEDGPDDPAPGAPEDEDPKDYIMGLALTPEQFLEHLLRKLESDYSVSNEPDAKYVKNIFKVAARKKRIPDVDEAAENWERLDYLIEKHGSWVLEVADNYWFDADDTEQEIKDNYEGTFGSPGEYAQNYAENMGEIPDWLSMYIDWEKMGKDFLTDKTTYDHNGGIVVFGNS
jgi:hypothetical protein